MTEKSIANEPLRAEPVAVPSPSPRDLAWLNAEIESGHYSLLRIVLAMRHGTVSAAIIREELLQLIRASAPVPVPAPTEPEVVPLDDPRVPYSLVPVPAAQEVEGLYDVCGICGEATTRHYTPCGGVAHPEKVLHLILRLVAEGKRPAAIRVLDRHLREPYDDGKRVIQSAVPADPPSEKESK
jgi:hypothetical protein